MGDGEALFYYMKGDPVPDHNEVVAEVGGGMGGIGSTVGTIGDSNANANADAYGNGNGNGNSHRSRRRIRCSDRCCATTAWCRSWRR